MVFNEELRERLAHVHAAAREPPAPVGLLVHEGKKLRVLRVRHDHEREGGQLNVVALTFVFETEFQKTSTRTKKNTSIP